MIKMSDLIKQQGDVIRTQTGIKKVEEATFGGKKLKIPQPKDFGGDMEKYLDALNKHMKDVEKALKRKKNKYRITILGVNKSLIPSRIWK